MSGRLRSTFVAVAFLPGIVACRPGDRAMYFIAHIDSLPPDERPDDWLQTRSLMLRLAPYEGEAAPDFALKMKDSETTIRLSEYHADRPRVLIFGSYT